MIDSHCHLNLAPLADDIDNVIKGAALAGVERILAPGVTVASWQVLQKISEQYRHVIPIDTAIGLHPYFLLHSQHAEQVAAVDRDDPISSLISALEHACETMHSSVKAIGETGLDGHIQVPMPLQQNVLDAQLTIANDVALPVILHHRKSHHLLFEALKKTQPKYGGVVHAFSGSIEVAKRYIDRGLCLGIGGTITYERAKKTRDTVAYLVKHHLDSLLLETDSPDMPMQGRQGQPNLPRYIGDVIDSLTSITGVSAIVLKEQTTKNYQRVFLGERV